MALRPLSSGSFPLFFEDKDSFKYYSPVFSKGGVIINTPNLKTKNRNLANNEIIGFVYLQRDKSVLKSKTFKATLTFLLLFTVSFLVANAFIFYVARRITKPLDLLRKLSPWSREKVLKRSV